MSYSFVPDRPFLALAAVFVLELSELLHDANSQTRTSFLFAIPPFNPLSYPVCNLHIILV